MKLDMLIEEFFHQKEDSNFYESSKVTYLTKLNIFKEYIVREKGLNDSNYEAILTGLSIESFINIFENYILTRKIKYLNSVNCYITVLKTFFTYLRDYQNIKNPIFIDTEKINELNELLDTKILKNDEFSLKDAEDKRPISDTAFLDLNAFCDKIIDEITIKTISEFNKKNNDPYIDFISALMTKLVMYTGVKPNKVLDIKLSDLNLNLNTINVSGFCIHLPNKLSLSLRKYVNEILPLLEVNSEYLFVKRDGDKFNYLEYNKTFRVINKKFDTNSAEIVAKYTIMEMIKKGINVSIIMDLTGFGADTYFSCQEMVNDTKNDLKRSQYLDSKLRSIDNFEFL
ncbi:site-specific integrase [Clostridium tyrobutyricum]|uniref:site-specific integrase n=1 Tax=Clostridium tyrobutyricum TaxID=1519 RepID=UPI001C38C2B6|nr:site-specific integrase [Clostridium tyrobutyricum]MBV4420333.1 site-specific integrase [Clostridium tyrobutyricum]